MRSIEGAKRQEHFPDTRSRTISVIRMLVVLAVAWTSVPASASAQDLFERVQGNGRGQGEFAVSGYQGRDRLDLRAGARLPTLIDRDSGSGRLGLSGTIESDFACGRFDLKANLKGLISKEAKDDFVNAIIGSVESELATNGLMLLAETSPTAFQLLQHWRVNANALLGIQYNRCAAIENAISDGMKGIRARAIKDCVDQKRAEGLSMAEALRACENSEEIRDLAGNRVKEIDLTSELVKAFKLGDVDTQHLERLLSKVKITKSGASGEIKAEPVLEEFDRLAKEYAAGWTKATETLAQDPKAKLGEEVMAGLAPSWAPRPLPVELSEIARIPPRKRRILIDGIARQAALLDVTVRVQKLERWLSAAAQHPQLDQATVRRYEQEVRDLRRQIEHLKELAHRQEEYNAALLGLSDTAQAHQSERAADALVRARNRQAAEEFFERAPKWGELPRRNGERRSGDRSRTGSSSGGSPTTYEGPGCTDCGSFGDLGRGK